MGAEDTLFQRFGKEFPKGTVLFSEGQPGKEMFVLQSGKVAISKKVRDVEKVLATLGPGEFFGEMALLKGTRRTADVTAIDYCQFLVISARDFRQFVRQNPALLAEFDRFAEERTEMNRRLGSAGQAGS